MHEKGTYTVKNGIIFNKFNNKMVIHELSLIVAKSQQLIYQAGDMRDKNLLNYYHEYVKSFKKQNLEEMAEDLEIITISKKDFFSQDDLCTLLNYALSMNNVKILDWLKLSELKLISKIQRLQQFGW